MSSLYLIWVILIFCFVWSPGGWNKYKFFLESWDIAIALSLRRVRKHNDCISCVFFMVSKGPAPRGSPRLHALLGNEDVTSGFSTCDLRVCVGETFTDFYKLKIS